MHFYTSELVATS